MKLADLQSQFFDSATRGGSGDVSWAKGQGALTAEARIEIYGRMYRYRLVDAVRADFPCTAALLGEEPFFHWASRYVDAFPSEHPDIGQFGRAFVGFLASHREALPRADLPELARLEWARAVVWTEQDAPPVTVEVLQAQPERFSERVLHFVPALRLVRMEHAVASVWRALESAAPVPPVQNTAESLAVWRCGWEPVHSVLDEDEATALATACAGRPLGEVVNAFETRESPEHAAFEALSSWFEEGWVASVAP